MGTKDGLMARRMKIARDLQEMTDDCAHWNSINPEKEPLDPDPDGAIKTALAEIDRKLGVQ